MNQILMHIFLWLSRHFCYWNLLSEYVTLVIKPLLNGFISENVESSARNWFDGDDCLTNVASFLDGMLEKEVVNHFALYIQQNRTYRPEEEMKYGLLIMEIVYKIINVSKTKNNDCVLGYGRNALS